MEKNKIREKQVRSSTEYDRDEIDAIYLETRAAIKFLQAGDSCDLEALWQYFAETFGRDSTK
jgi:hypothetical protein